MNCLTDTFFDSFKFVGSPPDEATKAAPESEHYGV